MTLLMAYLMISRFPYNSFKEINLKRKVPIFSVLVLALLALCIALDPPKVLLSLLFMYACYGPLVAMYRFARRRDKRLI